MKFKKEKKNSLTALKYVDVQSHGSATAFTVTQQTSTECDVTYSAQHTI